MTLQFFLLEKLKIVFLQLKFVKTSNWMIQNSLTENSDKCLFMSFGKTAISMLHVPGQVLKTVDFSKYLEIEIAEKFG